MEFKGTIINRNNRAKEQVLYKVIAEKDREIESLKFSLRANIDLVGIKDDIINDLKAELRALKSKEYRRSVRRKKQKVGEVAE